MSIAQCLSIVVCEAKSVVCAPIFPLDFGRLRIYFNALEHGSSATAVHLVRLVGMALAAELRSLVG